VTSLIALLCLTSFSNTFSLGAFPAILPELARGGGLVDWQLGAVASAFGFARMTADIPIGLFLTHHLRRAVVAGPCVLAAGVAVLTYRFWTTSLNGDPAVIGRTIRLGQGTATVIGMIPVGQKIELEGSAFLREKRIQGSSMGSNRFKVDMPRYVDFYMQGRLKLDEMITRRMKLDEVNEAFRAMKAGEVARSVLVFE